MNNICLNPVRGTTSNCTIAGPSKAKCECPPEFEGDHCEFRKKKTKYTFKKKQVGWRSSRLDAKKSNNFKRHSQ